MEDNEQADEKVGEDAPLEGEVSGDEGNAASV